MCDCWVYIYEFGDWLGSLETFMCKMWNYEKCYITNVYLWVWILGIEWEAFNYGNMVRVWGMIHWIDFYSVIRTKLWLYGFTWRVE